jgi:NAD(P)-dependent dehydrogenase (short-subunit alcohol dehydrogenase family)
MTRSVLVTGGASGIGRAAAIILAREGAALTVVDRAGDAAEETASIPSVASTAS